MKKKGIFIVIEGPDKSGKTTQAILIKKWLEALNQKVILTREPGGTKLSEKIRKLLLDPSIKIYPLSELFLYEAARAQHVQEKILPALKSGKIVICDRFTLATEAYQGYGRKIDLKMIKLLNKIATQNLKPDLTILMFMPEKEFYKRKRLKDILYTDRMEKESQKFRIRVNRGYRKLALEEKNIVRINATLNISEITEKIKERVIKLIKK